MKTKPNDADGGFKSKAPAEFLNYFGRDRWIHIWLREKRTKLVAAFFPRIAQLGVVPDTISYVGIALLAGVIVYFVRSPRLAVLFLLCHVLCDGLDGALARHTGKASQSGAFTDLVCDQLGMVVVAVMAIFHHLVSPLIGTVYITLYLIVVVFGVIINVMGLGTRVTITSKYFLYAVFAVWALWKVNLIPPMMYFFCFVMALEVVVGYLRLKRGIRKKFDTEVRFTEGDPYSSKLNYALNVAVPVAVLLAIVLGANQVPIRSFFDRPALQVSWEKGAEIIRENEAEKVLGFGVRDRDFLILLRREDEVLELRRVPISGGVPSDSFEVPSYVTPAFTSLPVYENMLLIADNTTRLLMGMDVDASFAAKKAVIVLTLPLGHLRLTAMATANWQGKKVWLAANYLYTRKTYVVDPDKAMKKGELLEGVVASYVNAAFPAGLTVYDDTVVELNRSRLNSLIYVASLQKLLKGRNLLDVRRTSFAPPDHNLIGPVTEGDEIVMLSAQGRVYRLPIAALTDGSGGQK